MRENTKDKILDYHKMEPPDKPYYKAIKQNLTNIVKHKNVQDTLLDVVMSSHKIVVHTLQFMKMYLLFSYDTHGSIPKIDHAFITNIMKVICDKSTKEPAKKQGRPPKADTMDLRKNFEKFFDEHYPTNQIDPISYKNMNTILDYLGIDVLTCYETNIKQHYVEYVERFVNVIFEKKLRIQSLSKDEASAFVSMLRKVKNNILNREEVPVEVHPYLSKIMPQRAFEKDSLRYDIQCHPQDYLPCMIYMMKHVESTGASVFNVFPLRTDIVPKYIRIDTTTVVHLFVGKENIGTKEEFLTKGNLVKRQADIWDAFFRTDKRCFAAKGYTFNYMIETDGVACSILLVRKDMVGKRFKPTLSTPKELYIDEADLDKLKGKKVVGIDPGKSDLMFCVSKEGDEIKKFRYTQDQRRKETKQKKYRNICDGLKSTTKVDGKTVKEWEAELSAFNRKTLSFEAFKVYADKKNEMNYKLLTFYQQRLFRKLKWNAFMNKKRSEARMTNRFKEIFGSPEDVVIGFGDWEQRKHMKFKEPTKGKGFRTLLRKAGYNVYLVDEYRTSCRCHHCQSHEGVCEKFRECKNPRPWKRDETILRHGLLRCKTCERLWNRDVNGSLNIHKVVVDTISKIGRPAYLNRISAAASAAQNQILDEDAKPQL